MRDRKTGKRLIARHLRSIVPGPLCLTGSATALHLIAHRELGYPVKRTSYIDYSAVKKGRTLVPPQWDFCCVSPPKLYRCGRLVLWTTQRKSHMTLAHEACKMKWSLYRIVQICPYVLPRLIRRAHSMWHAAAWFCWQPKACRRCVADCTHKRLGF